MMDIQLSLHIRGRLVLWLPGIPKSVEAQVLIWNGVVQLGALYPRFAIRGFWSVVGWIPGCETCGFWGQTVEENDQREKVRPFKMLIHQVRGVYEDLVWHFKTKWIRRDLREGSDTHICYSGAIFAITYPYWPHDYWCSIACSVVVSPVGTHPWLSNC